ncbi:protoporphyrinogen oxidase [Coraliomargarita sp. SDUM461004]|uniref:Coproporphyrinogen III oxidase n=1 Tax=Thalassobacterium sedimentorum TaxID=3041258 RepID=A0ABU1AE23_9BACT|nr:protoporphyrinogen oxidase [Coraliomargarita sp. SDUM461004]MDQ8192847.1 protoporphyrinogen oxidase [Coraliomargarita sp. SDUM461004]
MKKTAIIGSGITALTRAWQLTQRGHSCVVLESSPRIGGAIQSHRSGAYLAEAGPNSIQVNSAAVDRFLRSVPNLENRIITASARAKKRFILRNGRPQAVPMGPLSAITSPLWSLSGKLRVLKEPFVRPMAPDVEESAADFVRRRLGEELYQYAINPLIGGIYAGDPEQLSLRYAFPKLYALEQNHGGMIRGAIAKMHGNRQKHVPTVNKRIISFENGLAELPQALAAALGECVHTSVYLESIQHIDSHWQIKWNGQIHHYDEVILTTPAHSLAMLPLDLTLEKALRPLKAIDYPPVSVLSLAFKRAEVAHPLDGFGVLIPECEKRMILGVLFPSSIFAHRAPADEVLLTVFVGGERQPKLAQPDTDTLRIKILPELRQILGVAGKPKFVHHTHWPRAIPQYKLGYGELLQQMQTVEAHFPGLKLAGNYRTGISLSYCIESALEA